MQPVHLGGVDLNLLVALDALVSERNVTRAARRVGLSQPAMSHALSRLRHLLGDPLFVRVPGGMVPTARTLSLTPALSQALTGVRDVLTGPTRFDPKTARRELTIAASDYVELTLLPKLVRRLATRAPYVDLVVRPGPVSLDRLATGLLDLVIRPIGPQLPPGFHGSQLLEETFVCVMREGHPLSHGKLSLDRFCSASHVLISPGGSRRGFVDEALAQLGRERRVALVLAHFLGSAHIVAQSDLVVTLGRQMARTFQKLLPLVARSAPILIPPMRVGMVWHERQLHDPALTWLRSEVEAVYNASTRVTRVSTDSSSSGVGTT